MIPKHDIYIYFSGTRYVSGMCTRWDTSDYNISVELWLKKTPLIDLSSNVRPGAVKELKRVIFSPKFYDSSWTGKNTVKLRPVVGTELYRMRGSEKIIYVKNISSTPIAGNSGWLDVKIEGAISGGSI